MQRRYIACLHPPVEGSAWGVTFPDLPGCISAGDTFEEATSAAEEALALHVAGLIADGDTVPPPRGFEAINADPALREECDGAHLIAVPLQEIAAPKERINIMIAPAALRRIDAAASRHGMSRSAFVEAAADAVSRDVGSANEAVVEAIRRHLDLALRAEQRADARDERKAREPHRSGGSKDRPRRSGSVPSRSGAARTPA